jgi:hypothetical protein
MRNAPTKMQVTLVKVDVKSAFVFVTVLALRDSTPLYRGSADTYPTFSKVIATLHE